MLKKTITYTDYNGDERTEDFYFNLTKLECMELEFGDFGNGATLSESITTLMHSNDMGKAIEIIKRFALLAYGVKSPDGKRFIKNDDVREEFEQSPAFEELYWDLVTNVDKAADFFNGIIPAAVRESLGDNPKQELIDRANALRASKKQ